MPLPMVRRCCGCVPLETGFYLVVLLSTVACLANIAAGAWNLPRNKQREPEDNLISMSMVMFSTLSGISNLIAGAGAYLRSDDFRKVAGKSWVRVAADRDRWRALGEAYAQQWTSIFFIIPRRPGYLQLSFIFNLVFILCLFLIAVVTCLFSPELKKTSFLESPGNIALVVIMMVAGASYSLYHLTIVNALYRTMKDDSETAIPI